MTETEAEQALWTIKRGDDWRRGWDTSDDVSDHDLTTLLVQIRNGPAESDTLVASSDADDDVALIDTTGTDFDAGELRLHIDDTDTSGDLFVTGSGYWIEAQCEIDGDVTTFLRHRVTVEGQVAVLGEGS